MGYKLEISEEVERQIDHSIEYIVKELRNPSAARGVLQDIEHAYDQLEEMPEAFATCEDPYLRAKSYRKLALQKHAYVFIYRIEENRVFLVGFFHMLENYQEKL